jgi:cytochrome c peroxidase
MGTQHHQLSCVLAGLWIMGCTDPAPAPEGPGIEQNSFVEQLFDEIPNNVPFPNKHGFAATFASTGSVDLDNVFFTPQGTNGRHCGTCHAPEVGWSMTGPMVTALFLTTGGMHPIFVNHLDTDTPTADMSTREARWNATTMLRQGKFTRKINLPATRDFDLVGIQDPFGVSTPTTLFFFRRPMPTANLRSFNVHADNQMTVGTDLHAGLVKQARANITGAQQGVAPADAVVEEIATYEGQLAHAQIYLWDVGSLTAEGAHGGPAYAAAQPLALGRFDLYDAWQQSANDKRRQIWRGQEVFNNVNAPSGKRCGGCHSAANNGQNVNGALFDIGASRPEVARSDMAVFTFQSRVDGSLKQSTDPGTGLRTGSFKELNRFKVPTLRGLASRAPYFHGGIADTLEKVVDHYQNNLGFVFTSQERDDLVAFLKAL